MPKIKICGLTRPCDIDAVNEAKPEYAGFVFASSRRRVTPQQALALRERLDADIQPVGVFADETIENILALARQGVISLIQLHGSEDEHFMRELKARTDAPVIKAVAVRRTGDAQSWSGSAADYLLLDGPGGGTGRTFGWNLIGRTDKPFFLAGGLTVDNIAEALKTVAPFAVDVSSGVETDGYKDHAKITAFVRRVRNA